MRLDRRGCCCVTGSCGVVVVSVGVGPGVGVVVVVGVGVGSGVGVGVGWIGVLARVWRV